MQDKSDFYKTKPVSQIDTLRIILGQLENRLVNLPKQDRDAILQYLAQMDEAFKLIQQIESDTSSTLAAERQRFENIIRALQGQALTLLRKVGGLAAFKAYKPLDAKPNTAPWWYLDNYILQKRANFRRKLATIAVATLLIVIGLTVSFNTILKPDPNATLKVQQFDSAVNLVNEAQDYQGALAEIDIALTAMPNDIDAQTFKGALLLLLNREKEAQQAFEAAAQLADKPEKAFLVKGQTWQQLNQPELALEAAQTALSINPEYAEAWFLTAQIYAATGKPGEAYTAFETAAELAFEQENDTLYALSRVNLGYLTQGALIPPITSTLVITAE